MMPSIAHIIDRQHFFNLSNYEGACPCASGLTLRGVRFESHCWRSNSDLGVDVYYDSDDVDCPPEYDIQAAGNAVSLQLKESWEMEFPVRLHNESGAVHERD